jgi:hypothetical protein
LTVAADNNAVSGLHTVSATTIKQQNLNPSLDDALKNCIIAIAFFMPLNFFP